LKTSQKFFASPAKTPAWLSPFVATVLAVFGYRVWLFGMKHYAGQARRGDAFAAGLIEQRTA
jgi:hypothetical protein